MKIIRAEEEHLADVVEMASLLWRESDVTELQEEFRRVISGKGQRVYLCLEGDEPVGFIYVALRHEYVEGASSSPVGYVEGLYVRPEYRRRGIAHRLIEEATRWARKKGAKQLASDVEIENELSLDFHRAVGFNEANRIVCFIMDIDRDE